MHTPCCVRAAHKLAPAPLVLGLACGLLWGQANVGEISGQVSDSSSAAVPECAVTATHIQTGLKRTAKTQDNGIFVFAGLPEGTYDEAAKKAGKCRFIGFTGH